MIFASLTARFRRCPSGPRPSDVIQPSPTTTGKEEENPNPPSRLLDLPLEIRRIIWDYCFFRPILTTSVIPPPRPHSRYECKARNMMYPDETWSNKMELMDGTMPVHKQYLSSFLVNRQMSSEARDVFWGKAVLVLWKYELKHKGLDFERSVWRNIRLVAIDGPLLHAFLQVQSTLNSLEELYISGITPAGNKIRKILASGGRQQPERRFYEDLDDVFLHRVGELLLDGAREKSVNVHVRPAYETEIVHVIVDVEKQRVVLNPSGTRKRFEIWLGRSKPRLILGSHASRPRV